MNKIKHKLLTDQKLFLKHGDRFVFIKLKIIKLD